MLLGWFYEAKTSKRIPLGVLVQPLLPVGAFWGPTIAGPEDFVSGRGYKWWLSELEKTEGGIEKFAEGYKIFGFNRDEEKGGGRGFDSIDRWWGLRKRDLDIL